MAACPYKDMLPVLRLSDACTGRRAESGGGKHNAERPKNRVAKGSTVSNDNWVLPIYCTVALINL